MEDYIKTVFVLRLIERFTLTAIVLVIALVVLVAFWRTVHRIEFSVMKEKMGVAGATLIATPVLVLLALMGFTRVVLTNPIKLEASGSKPIEPPARPCETSDNAASSPNPSYINLSGATGTKANVASVLLALNCAKARSRGLKQAELDAIDLLKANELYANWPDGLDAKQKEIFWKWALHEPKAEVPSGDVLQVFHARDPRCEG